MTLLLHVVVELAGLGPDGCDIDYRSFGEDMVVGWCACASLQCLRK
jgi:hypothetical protein